MKCQWIGKNPGERGFDVCGETLSQPFGLFFIIIRCGFELGLRLTFPSFPLTPVQGTAVILVNQASMNR